MLSGILMTDRMHFQQIALLHNGCIVSVADFLQGAHAFHDAVIHMYLAGEGQDERPVFLPLLLSEGEVQAEALGVPGLPLLPASVEPADTQPVSQFLLLCCG